MRATYLLLLTAALGLGACSGDTDKVTDDTTAGDDDDDTVGDDDDDTTTTTGDTFYTSPYFMTELVGFSAWVGYNAQTQQISDFDIGGSVYPSTIDITLASLDWSGSYTDYDHYCIVSLDLVNTAMDPAVAQDPRLWWGVTRPAGGGGSHSCDGVLDPADYLAADPVGAFDSVAWSVAIGDWTQDVEDLILPYLNAGDEAYFFGGSIGGDLFGSTTTGYGPITEVYTLGYETDANLVATIDGGYLVNLDKANVQTQQGITTGIYNVQAYYLYYY